METLVRSIVDIALLRHKERLLTNINAYQTIPKHHKQRSQ